MTMKAKTMRTNRNTIVRALAIISAAYPGKIILSQVDAHGREVSNGTTELWLDILGDLEDVCVIEAVRDIVSAPGQWPPSVGDIRHRASELALGLLAPPSPVMAWERVTELLRGEPVQLSDDEKRALKFVGGASAVKYTDRQETVRAQFLRAYEEFYQRRIMETRAQVSTQALADSNRPALPAPVRVNAPPRDETGRPATQQQVREFLKGLHWGKGF